MGFRDNLEFYLNLSRKELQGLCKQNNLPANRSQVQLAKSLASIFKKKSSTATSSKERSSSPVETSFKVSYLPSKPNEKLSPPEETTRDVLEAFDRRTNSSESDRYRLDSSIKEMLVDGRPHSQSGNQLEIANHMDGQSLEKAFDADAEVVCRYTVNSGVTIGFGYSSSELGGVGIQENIPVLQSGVVTEHETQKSSPLRISNRKVPNPATTNNQTSSIALFPCRQERIVEGSIESGFASSEEISTRPVPSFQFFVSSEEGINLYVDLNSSPSEWIDSLNDKVNIHQKAASQVKDYFQSH